MNSLHRFSLTTLCVWVLSNGVPSAHAQPLPPTGFDARSMGLSRPERGTLQLKGSQPLLRAVEALIVGGKLDERILLGTPATSGQLPWQIALVMSGIPDNNRAQFCGGSLIGPTKVLTAAHCVDGGTLPYQVNVLVGGLRLSSLQGRRIPVSRIDLHPSWNPVTSDSDVALLTLSEPAAVTAADAIALNASSNGAFESAGTVLTVSGWGRTESDGRGSDELLWVNVESISNSECNKPSRYNGKITDGMLCAGSLLGGADSCQGDSGGPLASEQKPARLVGIVSWGQGCGLPNKPGVYTRVSKYVDWIQSKMK